MFLSGYFVEKGLDALLWSNDTAENVAELKNAIDSKTESINTILSEMKATISDMDADNPKAAQFVDLAHKLNKELSRLRPELQDFSNEAQRLSMELALRKQSEIEERGVSKIADVVIGHESAVTICEDNFSVGYRYSRIYGPIITVSKNGKTVDERVHAGESIAYENKDGNNTSRVAVQFLGIEDNQKFAKVNFDCLSDR